MWKPVHRSCNTNQSCVQRSWNTRNFEKVCYFVFYVFRLATQNLYCFMIVILTKTFFVYLATVQIRPRLFIWKWTVRNWASFCTSCKYRVYLDTWDCFNKVIYSVLLYNIHKYNNLVIIAREFIWDNCFQIMFASNIFLSLQSSH